MLQLQFDFRLSHVILFIISFRTMNTISLRKIKDGQRVETAMRFMVYLTKAQMSPTLYDAWICGGAIVSKDFIVTSAACVEDVQYMYAIAGYNKYVNVKDIANDECTKASRKKVVFICVPKSYDFAYDKLEKWAFIDIAAVKVESPYDFSSSQPIKGCSWVPDKIDINYNPRYQAQDTDAMVLGWGHKEKWRTTGDHTDYNQEFLHYSSILVMDKPSCKNSYTKWPAMLPIIDKYMICAMNEGNIDEKGNLRVKATPDPNTEGCTEALRVSGKCNEPQENLNTEQQMNPLVEDVMAGIKINRGIEQQMRSGVQATPSVYQSILGQNPIVAKLLSLNPSVPIYVQDQQNKNSNINTDNPNYNVQYEDITFDDIALNYRSGRRFNYTRKAGICQNDHGGPLVTWVGKHEVLIGVSSVFRVNNSFFCNGPYLFTSTQCNGAFLDCVINQNMPARANDNTNIETTQKPVEKENATTETTTPADETYFFRLGRRSKMYCDLPPKEKGFDVVERRISWRNHPDGPAQNELDEDLFERPSVPIQGKLLQNIFKRKQYLNNK